MFCHCSRYEVAASCDGIGNRYTSAVEEERRHTLNCLLFSLSPRIRKISDAALIATIDWTRVYDRDGKLGVYPVAIHMEVHLDGKIRLIPQFTRITVRGKLVRYVQPVLDKVSAELVIQGFLSAQVM